VVVLDLKTKNPNHDHVNPMPKKYRDSKKESLIFSLLLDRNSILEHRRCQGLYVDFAMPVHGGPGEAPEHGIGYCQDVMQTTPDHVKTVLFEEVFWVFRGIVYKVGHRLDALG